MSQYGQLTKNRTIQGCAKIVFSLHTARTENPYAPKTYSSASNFHKCHSDTPRHPSDSSQTPPRYPQGTWNANRQQQMPRNTARLSQTAPVSFLGSLAMSVGVWWRMLTCYVPQRCYGVIGGMFGGCLGESELNSWKLEVHKCVWGVYGFSILAVWSENTILAQPWMVRFSVNWPYWDIKIPKPPHISLPKMIGLGHFLQFLGSSERYYLLQLLLIALYQLLILWIKHKSIQDIIFLHSGLPQILTF